MNLPCLSFNESGNKKGLRWRPFIFAERILRTLPHFDYKLRYLDLDCGQTNSHFGPLRPTQEPSEHCMASWVQIIRSSDVLGTFPYPHDARKKERVAAKIAVLFIWKFPLRSDD